LFEKIFIRVFVFKKSQDVGKLVWSDCCSGKWVKNAVEWANFDGDSRKILSTKSLRVNAKILLKICKKFPVFQLLAKLNFNFQCHAFFLWIDAEKWKFLNCSTGKSQNDPKIIFESARPPKFGFPWPQITKNVPKHHFFGHITIPNQIVPRQTFGSTFSHVSRVN
jgi:hypothetical protein